MTSPAPDDAGFVMLDAMVAALIAAVIGTVLMISFSASVQGLQRARSRLEALQVAQVALSIGRNAPFEQTTRSGVLNGIPWRVEAGEATTTRNLMLVPLRAEAGIGTARVELNTTVLRLAEAADAR